MGNLKKILGVLLLLILSPILIPLGVLFLYSFYAITFAYGLFFGLGWIANKLLGELGMTIIVLPAGLLAISSVVGNIVLFAYVCDKAF